MGLETVSENTFEKQFTRYEKINTAGGVAEVVDIAPAKQKETVPTLFAPAWACTLPVYKHALKSLSGTGRRIISLNHPRYGGELKLKEAESNLIKNFPEAEVRKAYTLIDVLDHKKISQTDVISHSEGGLSAAIAATLRPDLFRNMVLFAPPGLIGKDSFPRLFKGFASQGNPKPSLNSLSTWPQERTSGWTQEELKKAQSEGRMSQYPEIPITEEAKEVGALAAREAPKYIVKNPYRGFMEGWGMSQVQIDDLLKNLHEQGIGIVVMGAVDDPVFPADRMASLLKKGTLDGFLSVRGGHGQIGDTPEHHMRAAEEMLTALQKKKEGRSIT